MLILISGVVRYVLFYLLLATLFVFGQVREVKVLASDGMANDKFGVGLDIEGEFAIIGSKGR